MMHLGNMRTALYTYLFTRKHGGQFVLRIEDTDQTRLVEGATDQICRTLQDIGMYWDEGPEVGGKYGPYIQSERKHMYLPNAKRLVETGKAYYCFCTNEVLEVNRKEATARGETYKYDKHCLQLDKEEIERRLESGVPCVIRQNVPCAGSVAFDDLIFGHIEVDCTELDDMILIKADGMPTYNFANVVDDHLMGITHVMRGVEYLSSTPKYNLLYEAFGWEKPAYIHLTHIMSDKTHKLSKRSGDAYYEEYIQKGFLKEAIVNYVVLLGWNPGDEREFFALAELVEAFSLEGLSKSPAIFDIEKLTWMNAGYIRGLSEETFTVHALPFYQEARVAHMDKPLLCRILQPRVEIFTQIPGMVDFLAELPDYDRELFINKKFKTDPVVAESVLNMALPALEKVHVWKEDVLHDLLIGLAETNGMKNGTLLWPIRIALSGKSVTPGGAIEIAVLLGRDEALKRLCYGRTMLKRTGGDSVS